MLKKIYSILAIFGFILPYAFFITWLTTNNFNVSLFLSEIVSSKLSMFAWADVLISAVALIWFIQVEGKKQNMDKLWMPILGTCTVGVSFGLPLFLLMREINRSKSKP
jgi:hypothetical protein